jgi:hypothetical protein
VHADVVVERVDLVHVATDRVRVDGEVQPFRVLRRAQVHVPDREHRQEEHRQQHHRREQDEPALGGPELA